MKNIEIIARGFIVRKNKVLLCKVKTKPYWFFPGGHMEPGENIDEALKRELQEEISVNTLETDFLGLAENAFSNPEGAYQEVNIVFRAEIDGKEIHCCENHLEFKWFDLDKVKEIDIKPENLKQQFLKWVKNKEKFYIK